MTRSYIPRVQSQISQRRHIVDQSEGGRNQNWEFHCMVVQVTNKKLTWEKYLCSVKLKTGEKAPLQDSSYSKSILEWQDIVT